MPAIRPTEKALREVRVALQQIQQHLRGLPGGSTSVDLGAGTILMSTSTAGPTANVAWIPIEYEGAIYYVPAWAAHDP